MGAALDELGVSRADVVSWGYPDLGLTELILSGSVEFCEKLAAEIREWQPDLVVGPSLGDLHPDHSACAIMLRIMRQLQSSRFEPAFELLEYAVHPPRREASGHDVELRLSPEQVARKRQAILQHATQIALSRGRLLAFAQEREVLQRPLRTGPASGAAIVSAGFASGRLRLVVPGAPARASFMVVALHRGSFVSYRIGLSAGNVVLVRHPLTDETLARGRWVQRRDNRAEIFLPGKLFRDAVRLFVKREGGRWIFDRVSWNEIDLASAAEEHALTPAAATSRGVVAIIPCYNVGGTCGAVVRSAADFADHVIAVNDGSTDCTPDVLTALAEESTGRITVLGWAVNRGKGSALLAAFRHALRQWPGHVLVTLDGDGQHRPRDVASLARKLIEEECDLVVGERLAREKMPLRSRIGNELTAALMKLVYPASPTDTQSGFRAFTPEFAREILQQVREGRYETELQILLLALRQGRAIGSVTIPTVYIDDNRLSHFRPVADSWRVYRALFRRSIR